MINPHILNIQKHIHQIENSKESIIAHWMSAEDVQEILSIHNIKINFFQNEYAIKVLQYYLGVINGDERIGNCPTMMKMLEFFQEKNITSSELFTICTQFRQSIIKESMHLGFFDEKIFDSIEYVFNANLRGVLKSYSDTICTIKEELKEFYTLVDKSLNEIYIFDKDSLKFTYVNTGARSNIGYSLRELQNMTPYHIKIEYKLEKFRKLITPLLNYQQKLLKFQTPHKRANGTTYDAEVRLQLMRIGGEEKFVAFINDVTKEVQTNRLLEDFKTLIDRSSNEIYILDLDSFKFIYSNESAQQNNGYSEDELQKMTPVELHSGIDKQKAKELVEIIKSDGLVTIEALIRRKDGSVYPVELHLEKLRAFNKSVVIGFANDISKRTKAIEEKNIVEQLNENLTKANKQIAIQLEILDKHVISSSTDRNGIITKVSSAFCEISGYRKDELIGANYKIIRDLEYGNNFFDQMWNTLFNDEIWMGEIKNRKKDGSVFWVNAIFSPLYDHKNNKIGYSAIEEDISDKKRIEILSITDALTEIFNRRHFNEVFPRIINAVKRKDQLLSFLVLDIDYFKQYNDAYGHQKGDITLKRVAQCIKNLLNRASDYAFRLGGEEFGVIFDAETREKALEFAESIRESIAALQIEHQGNSASIYVTASIGLVCKNGNEIKDMDEIYKETDTYLYKAKELGRDRVISNLDALGS